jgi:hypothetical protein
MSYPALVYGFFQVLRATKAGAGVPPNDVCISAAGTVTEVIARYHDVLARLEGRRDLRDEATKYEAIALALANPDEPGRGTVLQTYPASGSPLSFAGFFEKLYRAYDLRFVYAAPKLESMTRRLEWDPSSPALTDPRAGDYTPRVAAE